MSVIRFLLELGIFGLATSSIFMGMTLAAARRFAARRRRTSAEPFVPPVSVFKPLHGDEAGLEEHLVTFFEQDYPAYEILFGARTGSDPGLQTARLVAARYPHIPVKFVLTGEPWRINAKVCTLERMERAAAHDIFVVSDSDVRVGPEYLREVTAPFAEAKVGAVTCLYRGVAGGGLWAMLEAAGMSVEMTGGVLVAEMLEGMRFALGPTMAVRRAAVREMGGFGALGDYCSDDFVLGQQVAANGYEVVLSTHVIDHIVLNADFVDSQKHQIRWMKSTRFSRPKGHFGTLLTFSVPFGMLACAAALLLHRPVLGAGLLLLSVCLRALMAGVLARVVVRDRQWLRCALLYPLRDLMGFVYWAASYGSDRIVWRNQDYRLGAEGIMHAADGPTESEAEPVMTG
jgi:ceramide glucosyltransferase